MTGSTSPGTSASEESKIGQAGYPEHVGQSSAADLIESKLALLAHVAHFNHHLHLVTLVIALQVNVAVTQRGANVEFLNCIPSVELRVADHSQMRRYAEHR